MDFNITAKNVSMKYKEDDVLKNISFHLEHGKIYGLLGRNGAGKTSLLSLLASFREPNFGEITVGEENPFENEEIMPRINFLFEKDYTYEYDPVKKYFEFAKRYRPDFDINYAEELATRFKLPLDKPIKDLSSGMQSAFNAILGLADFSPITILDEVYLAMDAPTREKFYEAVIEVQQKKPRTMILSTHLVSEMDYLFDHVLILHNGELLVNEPFDELVNHAFSIIGEAEKVDAITMNMNRLGSKQLGSTKSVTVYENLTEEIGTEIEKQGLEVGPVSLQELFIHLTEEE